jgi:uncharacterized membrane protein YraQ (UPF0718 family)
MKRIPLGVIFMIVVMLIYALAAFINPSLFHSAILNFFKIIIGILPILAFVFLVLVVINLFEPNKISKHLGEASGVKGFVYTLMASLVISMPPYVLYPVLDNLQKKGMKNSLIATFLYNRNVQVAFVPAMIYYFGLKFTVVFGFYIILFSILSGLITGKLLGNKLEVR